MFATDLSQLIPQSAPKFQHLTRCGELTMLKKFLSKYILEVIPSILATVVGAYIVTHYINNKPDADKPQAAMASPTNPAGPAKASNDAAGSKPVKPDETAQAEKAAKAEAAKVEAARVKAEKVAADKAAAEKLASEKAAAEKLAAEKVQAEKAEKAAEAESRRAREKAVAKSAPVAPPAAEANAAPDDKRDANDLARAAIERLRSTEQPRQAEQPRTQQDAARVIETTRPQERRVNSVVYTPPSVQPLPPAVTVAPAPSEAEVMAPPARSPAPRSTEAQADDSMRLTPPADIPSRPLDLRGEQERPSVAEDVVSAAKSMFQAVVPR